MTTISLLSSSDQEKKADLTTYRNGCLYGAFGAALAVVAKVALVALPFAAKACGYVLPATVAIGSLCSVPTMPALAGLAIVVATLGLIVIGGLLIAALVLHVKQQNVGYFGRGDDDQIGKDIKRQSVVVIDDQSFGPRASSEDAKTLRGKLDTAFKNKQEFDNAFLMCHQGILANTTKIVLDWTGLSPKDAQDANQETTINTKEKKATVTHHLIARNAEGEIEKDVAVKIVCDLKTGVKTNYLTMKDRKSKKTEYLKATVANHLEATVTEVSDAQELSLFPQNMSQE